MRYRIGRPLRPACNAFFPSSDADNVEEFIELLSPARQAQLEREGGFAIVSTHFGKGFLRDGRVHPGVIEVLTRLSQHPGWFPPVSACSTTSRMRKVGSRCSRATSCSVSKDYGSGMAYADASSGEDTKRLSCPIRSARARATPPAQIRLRQTRYGGIRQPAWIYVRGRIFSEEISPQASTERPY